jgi:hydrogenase maturation protease
LTVSPKILIYGYGNPGRQDDGLGISVVERIEKWIKKHKLDFVKTDSNYQLNIEDAAEIADKELVIFVDASGEDINDFLLTTVEPSNKINFTSHYVTPSYLLNLCNVIYNKSPDVYLLHIKGYEWEFLGTMTEEARRNLEKSYNFLKKFIMNSVTKT